MKTFALAALLLGACGTEYQPTDPPVELPTDGPGIYRAVCASCHGSNGDGTADGPGILNPVRGFASYVVRKGRGLEMTEMNYPEAMPSHTTEALTDAQLGLVLDFLSAAPHPTEGDKLYARFCGNCHGVAATGGRVGKGITDETDEAREKVREGHHLSDYSDRKEYMPKWSETELTNDELAKIVAFLNTLPGGGGEGDDDDDDTDEGVDED